MLNQAMAFIYLPAIVGLSVFLIYRLRIGRVGEAGGGGFIYSGLILIFLAALVNFLQQQTGYVNWFLSGIYPIIDLIRFGFLIIGAILLTTGLALHFSYWNERDREVANHLGKLRLLDSLQQESHFPFPMAELLERILKGLLGGLEEEAGAVFLLNRTQRQFVLSSSVGLSREEVALLEYYPYGRNLVSQALEEEAPVLSADFRTLGGKAQLAASRFHSILVVPLISGKNRLGALVFFSQEAKHYSRDYINIITPIAEWLSEKVEVTRLGREVSRIQRELEGSQSHLDAIFKTLDRVIRPERESPAPSAFAEKCLGLADAAEVWLVGLIGGHLQVYGGTRDKPDFSESFRMALINAIPRNRPLILNQEGTDEAGNAIIVRSSILLPANTRGDALVLRNAEGPSELAEGDLRLLSAVAAMAGLIIDRTRAEAVAERRRRRLESIGRVLRMKAAVSSIDSDLKPFIDEIAGLVPSDSVVFVFRAANDRFEAIFCNRPGEEIDEISISRGEGSTGKAAIMKKDMIIADAAAVAENLSGYDEEGRNALGRLFGDRGKPVFQGDYPVVVRDRTAAIITLFGFGEDIDGWQEKHLFISLLVTLLNLRLEIDSLGMLEPESAAAAGTLNVSEVNELNNDLAIISGYCQLAERDPNLNGEASQAFNSIIRKTEEMARRYRSRRAATSENIASVSSGADVNKIIRALFARTHISDSLYMIGGRPFEVNLNLKEVSSIGVDEAVFGNFIGEASRSFTENVGADEIVTISSYSKDDFVYIDISRHRKNFPPVEQVAGFGRYLKISSLEEPMRVRGFMAGLSHLPAEFAYDKYSQVPSYFSFRFAPMAAAARSGEFVPDGVLTILAVDDQLVILELLAAMCQSMGYKILTARNGQDALAVFDSHRPDIVIADLSMPGMSGLELAAKIKVSAPQTPVILITGWGASIDSAKLKQAGVEYLLHKPFRLEQLSDLIAKIKATAFKG